MAQENNEVTVKVENMVDGRIEGREGPGADTENQNKNQNGDAFDETKYLSELGVKNKEELSTLLNSGRNLNNIHPDHISIAGKISANPNTIGLLDYIANGGTDIPFFWDLVNNTNLDEMDNFQVVLKRAIMENKDPKLSKDIIEDVLREKFFLGVGDDDKRMGTPQEQNRGDYELSQKASEDRKWLAELQSRAKMTPAQEKKEELASKETARLEKWNPVLQKGMEDLKFSHKVAFADESELEVPFDYKPSAEDVAQYNQILNNLIKGAQGYEATEKNIEGARKYALDLFVGQNFAKLYPTMVDSITTSLMKRFAEKYNGIPEVRPGANDSKDKKEIVKIQRIDNNQNQSPDNW